MSSIDMAFKGKPYRYHSCYDNFEWMDKFGDPNFQYHKLMVQVLILLILDLADRPLLPFDLESYAGAVKGYVSDLENYVREKIASSKDGKPTLDLEPLKEAAEVFMQNARFFHQWDGEWTSMIYGTGGFESSVTTIERIAHNTKMANFETDLLDLAGGVSAFLLVYTCKVPGTGD